MKKQILSLVCLSVSLCMACSDDANTAGRGNSKQDLKPCINNDECQEPYRCIASSCGIPASLGETCGKDDRVCVEGTCEGGICTAPKEPAIGDPCTTHSDCGNKLACLADKCAEKLGTGSACDDNAVCISGVCHEKACAEVRQEGEACGDHAFCKEGLWCGFENTCRALPLPGERCDENIGCAGDAICEENYYDDAFYCYLGDLTDGASCGEFYACASGWYCSRELERCVKTVANGEVCSDYLLCSSSSVCLNGVCTQNLGDCETDSDCGTDSYCCNEDACNVKNVCIPYGEGPRGDTDETCEYQTVPGMFEAAIQCEWTAQCVKNQSTTATQCTWTATQAPDYPNHANVLMTPLVIDTPHDSGQANEIVFVTYNSTDGSDPSGQGTNINYYGVIRILNAETCALHESIFDDNNHIIAGSNIVVADVTGDGNVEIFASRGSAQKSGAGGGIVAWHWIDPLPPSEEHPEGVKGHYGFWWKTDVASASTLNWGGSAIHDINNDGIPEIIGFGGEVFDATTGKRLNRGQTIDELQYTPTLGDFDNDKRIEIIGKDSIYEWDTEQSKWVLEYENILDGAPVHHAFADFGTPREDGTFDYDNFDGRAEIVSCGSNRVRVTTLEGKHLLDVSPSGDKGGGPCTVGDFDGDGRPEVATAFGYYYRIFDPLCTTANEDCQAPYTLWEKKSQDLSSASTGSSLFDFDGDGAMEAVYADECYTRVYDGKTGDVLFSSYHTSSTWHEYPVIADVDNDESAEIVVGSNNAPNCNEYDPIHRGLRCEKNADCRSRSCVDGLCRCTKDDQCNAKPDAYGYLEYACVDGITAADKAGGKVCRAKHQKGAWMTGVRVLRDRLDRWTSSRNIWNQHAYNITNILDDMTIPKTEDWIQNHMSVDPRLNNFRQNVQGKRGRNVAPDITGRFTKDGNTCSQSGGKISLGAVICNRGTKMVASQMPATFYLLDDDGTTRTKKLCTSYTSENVPIGGCLPVSCTINDSSEVLYKKIVMVANDDGDGGRTTVECNEDNNEDFTTVEACPIY